MSLSGPQPRRAAAAIFLMLLGVYLLTTGGHLYAIDEEMMYDLSEAIGSRDVIYLNNPGPSEAPVYSSYGPGQSLAALPLFWAGELAAKAAPPDARAWLTRAAVGWLNPIITALLAALIYMAGRRIAAHWPALLAALAYGLGSTAWPHSKTFFAEPLTALLWFGSFLLLWRPNGSPLRLRDLFLAGVLAGLAPAVKIQAGIVLPILGLYAIYQCKMQNAKCKMAGLCILHFALGAALPLLALAAYNAALFGSPLRTGYGDSIWHLFNVPFWEGFGGQIWGLRRGLIWCAPLTLLAPLGLKALWRHDRGAALICLAVPLSQLLFYATWYAWDGAGAWGPRFLNAALPFMMLPLAALVATPLASARWLRAAAVALAALTIPVQIGALSININQVLIRPGADAPLQTLAHIQLTLSRLARLYERRLAPNRLVLWSGFAPSEGKGNALLPRWTRPEATVIVRAVEGPATLHLAVQSCWAVPVPTRLSMRLNGVALLSDVQPCPGRIYRLLLPPGASQIGLSSPGWEPVGTAEGQADRRGVYVAELSVSAGGRQIAIEGDRLPAEGMPIQAAAMRTWMGEVRLPLWDYWWAYLPLLPLPASVALAIGVGWAGVALTCLAAGAALARKGFREAGQPPPLASP